MIHPENQAFDLIAWSGRRLAWPAIYVIFVIRGHKRSSRWGAEKGFLEPALWHDQWWSLMACPLSGASHAPGWSPASLKIGALGGLIW